MSPPRIASPPAPAGRRAGHRAIAVLTIVVVAAVLVPAVGEATPGQHPSKDRKFGDGVWLRTRGYIPDNCLISIEPCLSTIHEYTAQARLIQTMAARHPTPHPYGVIVDRPKWSSVRRDGIPDTVQWEVGDRSSCRTGEPDPPAPCWRIDVLVDHGPPTILEVKRWSISAPTDVREQLDRYIEEAAKRDLVLFENTELNRIRWALPYIGTDDNVWCVWAHPPVTDPNPGAIYFAPRDQIPYDQVEANSICRTLKTKERVQEYLDDQDELVADVGNDLDIWTKLLLAVAGSVRPAPAPTIIPTHEPVLVGYCTQCYAVVVPQDPTGPTTLVMDYGDGTSESFRIAQGSGFVTVAACHGFPEPGGTYLQRATIVETGAWSVSVTQHDLPLWASNPSHLGASPTHGPVGTEVEVAGSCWHLASIGCGTDLIFSPLLIDDSAAGTNHNLYIAPCYTEECANPHPTDGLYDTHQQATCTADSTQLNNVQLIIAYTTKATFVEGSGDIPQDLDAGKYIICAEPAPDLLWAVVEVTL